jgi:hypothetical protein
MEVRPLRKAVVCLVISALFFGSVSCGKQMDMDTQYGRDARLEEANILLSKGYCQLALDTILPLYESVFNTDEITVVTASAYACFAGFNFLTLASDLATVTNKFQAVAKTMSAASDTDGKISNMYRAVDILTAGNTLINASGRSSRVNSYMVFLQLGLMGAILSGYGAPSTTTGTQTALLVYSNPRVGGEMANVDACALVAAVSAIVDSASAVSGNSDITTAVSSLNTVCTNAGTSCSSANRDRTACTGANGEAVSVVASSFVTQINSSW